jgi:hypothetical protein
MGREERPPRFGTETDTLTQIELRESPSAASEGYGCPLDLEHSSSVKSARY